MKVRAGVVGLGNVGKWYLNEIIEIPDSELCYVCDEDLLLCRKAAEQYGAIAVQSYQELVTQSDVDVICICTPNHKHHDIAIAAATAGKHLIIEKPIATSLTDANHILDVCTTNNLLLSVISQHRFDPNFSAIKNMLNEKIIGKPLYLSLVMNSYRQPAYYSSSSWHGDPIKEGGGVVINQGIHYIDLILWLLGPVHRIVAKIETCFHNIKTEDTAHITLDHENGVTSNLIMSTAAYPSQLLMKIVGTDATISLVSQDLSISVNKEGVQHQIMKPELNWKTTHQAQLADIFRSILHNTPLSIPGGDGVNALGVCMGIYLSGNNSSQPVIKTTKGFELISETI